jgi:ppGpp synthetase/RelA/SpoT-type nucleotidyltranferase
MLDTSTPPPSRSSIKKASKRIRHGRSTTRDHEQIRAFRDGMAVYWAEASEAVEVLVEGISLVSCSRLKRMDAIVRKCLRDGTGAQDMEDLLGIRLIIRSSDDIDAVRKSLESSPSYLHTRDYTSESQGAGYRALHIIHEVPSMADAEGRSPRFEIQVRTWGHHLWASLSEALGQRTKEGDGPEEYMMFLSDLGGVLDNQDVESCPMPSYAHSHERSYYALRVVLHPFDRSITPLGKDLEKAVAIFGMQERKSNNGIVPQTILLNAASEHDYRVTHISLFPRSLLAELIEGQDCKVPTDIVKALMS